MHSRIFKIQFKAITAQPKAIDKLSMRIYHEVLIVRCVFTLCTVNSVYFI